MSGPKINESGFKEGMLIFESLPKKGLGEVISNATDSDILHVGILHKNEKNQWVVIESIGRGNYQPPVDKFIARSGGVAWFKEIDGLSEDAAKRFTAKAADLSKAEYDIYFKYDNNLLYCSELVALAAQAVGVDLFDVGIPTSWLDRSEASAADYLKKYHNIDIKKPDPDPIPPDWRILPPHTLFFSDKLKDPDFIKDPSENMPKGDVPSHALYDTLPGKTPDEKFAYLKGKWEGYKDKIKSEKESINGYNHYKFTLTVPDKHETKEIEYGLILFGQFPEEEKLARLIITCLNKN